MTSRIDIRDASLIDFLPESIASDPEIIAMSLAIDPELRAVSASVIEATILPRIDSVPEWVLNELAWACRFNRLQIWDSATVEGKRAFLRNFVAIRKKSGTKFAVRRAFDLLSVDGKIVEWFEEGGPAYTYRIRITVTGVGLALAQLQQIGELTHRFASTRSKLREFAYEIEPSGMELRAVPMGGFFAVIPFGGP